MELGLLERRTKASSQLTEALSVESLRIHPAALEEAEAAVDWYAQRSMLAGGMSLVGQNPEQYLLLVFGIRYMTYGDFLS